MTSPTFSSYPVILEKLPQRNMRAIIDTLDMLNERLGEFSDEFVVIGGASMVLRNLRATTTDIDILSSDAAFSRMLSFVGALVKLPPQRALDNGATNKSVWLNTFWTKVPVSAATEMGDGYYPISYNQYNRDDLELIGGHAVMPLDHVWDSKVALQRPKDLPDLAIIAKETGRSQVLPAPIYQGPYLDS